MEAEIEKESNLAAVGERLNPRTFVQSVAIFLGITFAIALSCTASLSIFIQGFWTIAPIWVPAGVGFVAFRLVGHRAWLPSILGYCSLWLRFDPITSPFLGVVPLLYPISGYLMDRAERWFRQWLMGHRFRGKGLILSDFIPQALVLLPFTGIVALFLNATWFFVGVMPVIVQSWDSFFKIWTLVFVSHYLGVLTVAPVGIELIKERALRLMDFSNPTTVLGMVLSVFSLSLVAGFFSGAFPFVTSPPIAVSIPFTFLIMGALFLNQAQSAFFLLLWCILSFVLSGMARGPFGSEAGIAPIHFELAFYNLFIVFTVSGVAFASALSRQRVRQNELLLEAAEVIPWRWSRQLGLRFEEERGAQIAGDWPLSLHDLACLEPDESLAKLATTWNCRLNRNTLDPKEPIWESVGRIVERNRRGEPDEIIGLIRNVAIKDQVKEALLTVEYQNERLRGLTSQLNPHFLFNSLNMIRVLVHSDPSKAEKAVLSLAQLLRMTLKDVGKKVIPFASELKHIEALLDIASMRFEGRLRYEIKINNVPPDFVVPAMMILNFVENALTHGIAKRENGGKIELVLTGDKEQKNVTMELTNAGVLDQTNNQGVGLNGARQRLELLYGANASFSIKEIPGEKVLCTLKIPVTP